ncbi:MAG: diguanylate cyclase [Desulfovibrio sp.]
MKIKVLIVDDSESIRRMLTTQLKLNGFETEVAVNGLDGLEKAAEFEPDIVLLDIMMPEMDGIEACKRLRTNPQTSHMYVLMLTAKDKVADKVEGLDSGGDDYLAKPFDPEELFARLRRGYKIAEERRCALFDPLTKLFNRRSFQRFFDAELNRAQRHNHPMSVFMTDIDFFKRINDTYGHNVGDIVLQELAELLKTNLRSSDILCRWGGEEFLALLPETTADGAFEVADKIRKIIETYEFPQVGQITASFGVTQFIKTDNAHSFFERADTALYDAKDSGRNKTVVK